MRIDDPAHVQAQYITEENLETRRSVWHPTADGRDPTTEALDAIVADNPLRVLEIGPGTGMFAVRLAAALPDASITTIDQSERLLANVSRLLATCVEGITADRDRMRRYAESSPSVVTPLNKYLGYEEAAKVAKRALADGQTIRDTVVALGYVEQGRITEAQLDGALDIESMTRTGE